MQFRLNLYVFDSSLYESKILSLYTGIFLFFMLLFPNKGDKARIFIYM